MIYPISLLSYASSVDARLLAIFVIVGCAFLLAIADAISIVIAYT